MEFAADGQPGVGRPLRLRAVARGLIATDQAELAIFLPDVEAAEQGGWKVKRSTPGQRLAGRDRKAGALPAGGTLAAETQVRIPEPGYYRVFARVRKVSAEPNVADGVWYQEVLMKDLWLYVDAAGGRVTAGFDPSFLPDSIVREPGPQRRKSRQLPTWTRRPADDAATPKQRAVGAAQPSSSTGGPAFSASRATARPAGLAAAAYPTPASRRIVFLDSADTYAPVYSPALGVYVRWDVCEYVSGQCYDGGYSYPDAGGYFEAYCPNDGAYYMRGTYQVYGDPRFSFYPFNVGGTTEDAWTCTQGGYDVEVDGGVMAVYNRMGAVVDSSRAKFAPYSRGPVTVEVTISGNISKYDSWSDYISIQFDGPNRAVWGEYGRFTASHEYGHALHAKALGGINSYGDCQDHNLGTRINMGCAFKEGFADYHAVASVPSWLPFYASTIQTNYWYSAPNGIAVEGPVAAFMLDLTDPAYDSDGARDAVALPGGYVASLIKDCRVRDHNGVSRPIDGTDYLVYCAERTVDAGTAGYFSSDRLRPRGLAVTPAAPSEWSLSGVRTAWRWNLFAQ